MNLAWDREPYTRNQKLIFLVGILLVPLLGVLDFLTGGEIASALFYLIPIYLTAWYVGRWPGMLAALLSGISWLAAGLLEAQNFSHILIPFWNMSTRLFIFVLAAWLISEIRLREKRRRVFERLFFHDVLNIITGIRGFAEVLHERIPPEQKDICDTILTATDQVIEEIEDQRILSSAVRHELHIEPEFLHPCMLLEQVLQWHDYRHEAAKASLCLDPNSDDIPFVSDQVILNRILCNLVKNAMEAAQPQDTVTAGCRDGGNTVEFWVRNPQYIPENLQGEILKNSFSTKGPGRGLGICSIRLLSREIGGEVSFTSYPDEGTTFVARYPKDLKKFRKR